MREEEKIEQERIAGIADLAWGPMDAEEAARFLKVSDKHFGRLAPSLPRLKKEGLGYRYLRSALLDWLRSNEGVAEPVELPRRQRRQADGNPESSGVARGSKKDGAGKVTRLV